MGRSYAKLGAMVFGHHKTFDGGVAEPALQSVEQLLRILGGFAVAHEQIARGRVQRLCFGQFQRQRDTALR